MTHPLEALAARCEKAEGPDRELDADIATAVSLPKMEDWSLGKVGDIPAYSASLDAAMTLVPEDVVGWRMDWSGRRAIVRAAFGGIPGTIEAWAATPALALCAAALRSRVAQESSK